MWYQTGVRLRRFILLAALLAGACTSPAPQGPEPSSSAALSSSNQPVQITPDNIRRMRGAFPTGFEVAEIRGTASPAKFWGFSPGWTAYPPQCAALADPAAADETPRGLSGSGNAGIIYTVVGRASSPGPPSGDVVSECGHFSVDSGRTTAVVDQYEPPAIEGVTTVAMVVTARTVVEGGTETDSRAKTVIAYLGDFVAFVTVVTDPGLSAPQLSPDFAANFLSQTVATLRG
jgi:hypothetical protein